MFKIGTIRRGGMKQNESTKNPVGTIHRGGTNVPNAFESSNICGLVLSPSFIFDNIFKRKSPGKPRLFLQSFEKNYFFLAAFLAVFLPAFFADFLAAFFLGAAFFAAFFAMVFGFEKFICDEVIKNYDTKEILAIVFFNTALLISMICDFISSHFLLDFSSSIII
ncbi:hypothetical protein BH11BAC7_BH11BAC7_32080 [soil metagenome]